MDICESWSERQKGYFPNSPKAIKNLKQNLFCFEFQKNSFFHSSENLRKEEKGAIHYFNYNFCTMTMKKQYWSLDLKVRLP